LEVLDCCYLFIHCFTNGEKEIIESGHENKEIGMDINHIVGSELGDQ
jgi:hypothetical protein